MCGTKHWPHPREEPVITPLFLILVFLCYMYLKEKNLL